MINHEVNKTQLIEDDIEVYSGYAKELGDNGKTGDTCVTAWITPAVGDKSEYVYLTTNGDPVLVGWINIDGEFERADGIAGWIEDENMEWLREILAAEFLV